MSTLPDPAKMPLRQRKALQALWKVTHYRVRGGYKPRGSNRKISLATTGELEMLKLVIPAMKWGHPIIDVTYNGRLVIGIMEEREARRNQSRPAQKVHA